MNQQGVLFVIATPIGNLADITLRALDTLKDVKILLAEDTRISRKLLDHYGIQTKLVSLHEYNESQKIDLVLKQLKDGINIGLVSDAGTPLVSDPGFKLMNRVIAEGIDVRAIPGPSALTTAICIAGLPCDRFSFEGFLPKNKSERSQYLRSIKFEKRTLVFYESPKRILDSITSCIEILGGERRAVVLRELTKQFEQHIRGTLEDVLKTLNSKPEEVRGEFVLLLHGLNDAQTVEQEEHALELLTDLRQHLSHRDAVEIVAKHSALAKNRVYEIGLTIADKNQD